MTSVIDNKYVIFKLEKEYYGIPINRVIYIEKMHDLTRIPNAPSYVKGVMNLRGEVIPLIDLRSKMDMATKEADDNSRIIVISEEDMMIGLIVDTSSEVIEIERDEIDNPPSSNEDESLSYICGIGKVQDRLILLLELSKILG